MKLLGNVFLLLMCTIIGGVFAYHTKGNVLIGIICGNAIGALGIILLAIIDIAIAWRKNHP